jgi:hypothetical protein
MPRSLLALSLVFYCFHASAFFTASTDKPDPYARRHYTAADLPAAKRTAAAKKAAAAAKAKTPTDAEIMAEIEREDAGTEAGIKAPSAPKVFSHKIANPVAAAKPAAPVAKPATALASKPEPTESSVALKVESAPVEGAAKNTSFRPSDKSVDEFAAPAISAPAKSYPSVVVCRFSLPGKQKRASITSRYLISDSDGFEACNQHGGEVTAGNDDDRTLMNVKDSAILKRTKK